MTVEELEKKQCTGCYACYNKCPLKCITMEPDMEGFFYPIIQKEKCTHCGACSRVCPSIHLVGGNENRESPEIYAAWSLDDEIRLNSTSGGIFSEIAMQVLNNGGYICGAQYGKNHHIKHNIINTKEGLIQIRQSKYAQSDIGDRFIQIRNLLLEQKTVMFCGTPCECAGLKNYLGKSYDNLIIIDFICRGVNSPKVYERYLCYLEEKFESKITKVWFKNKTYGWNRFSTRVEFANGQIYLKDRDHDLFILGYIRHNLYMRPSCATCHYKQFPRVSDVTLADFWGVRLTDQSQDIEKGTSLVMLHSSKGDTLFENIQSNIFYEKKCLEDALGGNPSIVVSPVMNSKRDWFFKNLDCFSFEELMRICCSRSILDRVLHFLNRLIASIVVNWKSYNRRRVD